MEQVTVGVFRNPVGVIIPTLRSNIAGIMAKIAFYYGTLGKRADIS